MTKEYYDLKLTRQTEKIAKIPPIIRFKVTCSARIRFAVEIAINGTVNINTLVWTGPKRGPAYIKIDVPKHIAAIDTKKKLIKK